MLMRHDEVGKTRGEFKGILAQVVEWLQQDGRVSYRSVKRQFDLDDTYFEDLKEGLLYTHAEVVEDDGRGFVWTGEPSTSLPNAHHVTNSEMTYHPVASHTQ